MEDARTVKQGDSIQVLNGDVTWTVIWLRAGKVRAFTRVSKTLASGRELSVLSRVAVTLAKAPLAKGARCVRVEPNGGAKMRSNDLAYPWVELKRCRPHVQEVADPWVQDG